MPTQAKRETIDSLVELLKKSDAVFITEYRGLTVKKISVCRKNIRQAGGEMKVCKNTLMRIGGWLPGPCAAIELIRRRFFPHQSNENGR